MGILNSNTDRRTVKEAGRIVTEVCNYLIELAKPGVSTVELEAAANRQLALHRSSAPFKQFEGYGQAICVSLNDEVVNGPPSRERILKDGDLVSIALGAEHRGYHGKIARTVYLGDTPPEDVQRLLTGTQAAIDAVIHASANGAKTLADLIQTVPQTATVHNLVVVKDTGGAGIGKKLHDDPHVPNNPEDIKKETLLEPGLAFTLMPMFSLGDDPGTVTHEDGWTMVTVDHALSAHFADGLIMTDNGLERLTGLN